MNSKAVILVGGANTGTRLRPLTLDIAKPLLPVGGRAIIWHCIQALSKVEGLTEVILIGFWEDSVFSHFIKESSKDFPNITIRYLREYQALGTGGALHHFKEILSAGDPSHLYVLHSDIACAFPLEELKKFHETHGAVATIMGVKVPRETATKYGSMVIGEDSRVSHYVEKPQGFISDTINAGVYLFSSPLIFDEIKEAISAKVKRVAQDPTFSPRDDKLQLEVDIISRLASSGKLFSYVTESINWVQIKTPSDVIPANALILQNYSHTNPSLLRRRSPTVSLLVSPTKSSNGPEILPPCCIDESAVVDSSAKIGPNVSIGAGVVIGQGARVKESIILDGCTVGKNALVVYSILAEECHLGAWARIEGKPGGGGATSGVAVLGKNVRVGPEVHIRSCIVLPSKNLGRSAKNEVLL